MNNNAPTMMENFIRLARAVLCSAVTDGPAHRESPEWYLSTAGRFWCDVSGLNPQRMFETSTKYFLQRGRGGWSHD